MTVIANRAPYPSQANKQDEFFVSRMLHLIQSKLVTDYAIPAEARIFWRFGGSCRFTPRLLNVTLRFMHPEEYRGEGKALEMGLGEYAKAMERKTGVAQADVCWSLEHHAHCLLCSHAR